MSNIHARIEKLLRMDEGAANKNEADNARRLAEKLAREHKSELERLPDPIGPPKMSKTTHQSSWDWPPKGPK